jgi:Uma2 family endonuclease
MRADCTQCCAIQQEIFSGKLSGVRPLAAQEAIVWRTRCRSNYWEPCVLSGDDTAHYAFPDNVGFAVNLPHRDSFSPDAAWDTGQDTGLEFCEGAPRFAVEVRSKNDYGPAAEQEIAAKRADYFACGTQVVWDVDLLSADVIKSYKASDPEQAVIFRRGEIADAEPAVPGWQMAVIDLFE